MKRKIWKYEEMMEKFFLIDLILKKVLETINNNFII
jgi:hypothetical protein